MAKRKSTRSKTLQADQPEARQLVAFAVSFRRKRGSDLEEGLFVGRHDTDEAGLIFGMDGRVVVGPVWDYHDTCYRGCLIVHEDSR